MTGKPMSRKPTAGRNSEAIRSADGASCATRVSYPFAVSAVASISAPSTLSSTTRILGESLRRGTADTGANLSTGASSGIEPAVTRGRRTTNSLPFPGPSLLADTVPPCRSTRLLYDSEPQSQAALRSIDGLPLRNKEVKYARQHFRRNAHACIPYTNDYVVVVTVGSDRDVTAGWSVLCCICQQVGDDLIQTGGIALHRESRPLHLYVHRMRPLLEERTGNLDRLG